MSRFSLFRRGLALLVGTALTSTTLTVLTSAPAAAYSGSVSARDGVLYNDCRDHTYRYNFDVEAGYEYSLSYTATAYGPDGESATSDFEYDVTTSGSGEILFCGYEMPGRYKIEAEVEACNYDYDCYTFTTRTSSFRMRKPRTRTALSVVPRSPRFNQVTSFKVRSRDERPGGYFPTDGAQVALEVRARGRWARVRGSKSYAWDGKATVQYRWNIRRPVTVRARTLNSADGSTSTSRPVTIRLR